ncbi:hypothetical protein BKA70DRAFT_469960 [Coprinopsis sp. MPI-PUGE-AT-0042]|nr:hypothetical protein BKA70DRAFT_469960 [Coprinopsis sp. MPI-PUGE-AT-0042]
MTTFTPLPFASLPEELQGYIFELAADGDPKDAPDLMLVSHLAAAWVRPRIFREAVVSSSRRFPFASESKKLLGPEAKRLLPPHLRRLCVAWRSLTLKEVLQVVPTFEHLVDLAVWIEFPRTERLPFDVRTDEELVAQVFGTLDSLISLRRLSFVYESMSRLGAAVAPSLAPAWCTRLKYLELIYWHDPGDALPIPFLVHMEALTHLSLLPPMFFVREEHEPALLSALEVRPSLQVMLIQLRQVDEEVLHSVPGDARIVYHRHLEGDPIKHWRNQDEEFGKWATAEAVVARRREQLSDSNID